MLKLFTFLLIIIGLCLINSISIVVSQTDVCSYIDYDPLNYYCNLGNQTATFIELQFELPSENHRLVIDTLPMIGRLSYYDENTDQKIPLPRKVPVDPNLYIYLDSNIYFIPLYYESASNFDGNDQFIYSVTDNYELYNSGYITIVGTPYKEIAFKNVHEKFFDQLGNSTSEIKRIEIAGEMLTKYRFAFVQDFENGTIFFRNNIFVIFGDIFNKWQSLDGINGLLGIPVSNVKKTVDKSNVVGFFQEFKKGEQKGAIYLVNGSTNEIHGGIYEKWKTMGAENSVLGFPTSDEFPIKKIKDGVQSNFTNGILYWNPLNSDVLSMNYTKDK